MDLLKSVLLTALIFVPLEQMLALHPRQQVFRRGWTNDLFYLLLNGQITSLCVGVLLVGMTITAAWLVPVSVRTAIAGQPYWQQIIEVVILSDIGVYFVHRTFHTVPWLWRSPCDPSQQRRNRLAFRRPQPSARADCNKGIFAAAGIYAWLLRHCYRRLHGPVRIADLFYSRQLAHQIWAAPLVMGLARVSSLAPQHGPYSPRQELFWFLAPARCLVWDILHATWPGADRIWGWP